VGTGAMLRVCTPMVQGLHARHLRQSSCVTQPEVPRDVWVISGHPFLHSCGAALCMLSAHAINPGNAGVLSLPADGAVFSETFD
jgi:hypothetical protein